MRAGLLQIQRGGENTGLLVAELREDVAALVADEAVAVEALALSVPMRLAATTGTTFETAWPIIARRHMRLVSRSGSCGSVPIAVGKSRISAPSSIRLRAVSGYH